jgi:hypothetical protein
MAIPVPALTARHASFAQHRWVPCTPITSKRRTVAVPTQEIYAQQALPHDMPAAASYNEPPSAPALGPGQEAGVSCQSSFISKVRRLPSPRQFALSRALQSLLRPMTAGHWLAVARVPLLARVLQCKDQRSTCRCHRRYLLQTAVPSGCSHKCVACRRRPASTPSSSAPQLPWPGLLGGKPARREASWRPCAGLLAALAPTYGTPRHPHDHLAF